MFGVFAEVAAFAGVEGFAVFGATVGLATVFVVVVDEVVAVGVAVGFWFDEF